MTQRFNNIQNALYSPKKNRTSSLLSISFPLLEIFLVWVGIGIFLSFPRREWWTFTTQAPVSGGLAYSIPARPPFAFDRSRIYLGDYHGHVYALNRSTHMLEWTFSTNGYSPYPPTVDGNGLVAISDFDAHVYALDAKSGRERWRFLIPGRFQPDTPPIITDTSVLVGARNGTLYALDKKTGKIRWSFSVGTPDLTTLTVGEPVIHFGMMTTDADHVFINSPYHVFFILDGTTGRVIQTVPLKSYIQKEPVIVNDTVYVQDGMTTLIAINKITGSITSTMPLPETGCTVPTLSCSSVFPSVQTHLSNGTNELIRITPYKYTIILSEKDNSVSLTIITPQNQRLGPFSSLNIAPSTMVIFDNTLFFATRDLTHVYAIPLQVITKKSGGSILRTCCRLVHPEPVVDITYWRERPLPLPQTMEERAKQMVSALEDRSVSLTITQEQQAQPIVYDITLTHDDRPYRNPWSDVSVFASFVHQSGQTIRVKGFYYDQNTWVVRFAFPKSGLWKWRIDLNAGGITIPRTGTLNVVFPTPQNGYLRIRQNDPKRFVLGDGTAFWGRGIEDSLQDYNADGNPINQWASIDTPPLEQQRLSFTDMNTYLRSYNNSGKGFNLYRFSVDNNSFRLWRTIAPGNNIYSINNGIWADELVRMLRKNGYHIWMTVFGFEPPFPNDTSQTAQSAVGAYLDYIVARYSAYVDVWELSNEASPSTGWINFAARYLKAIDPYNHPVTVNWQRPDLAAVDITSIHWYDAPSRETIDAATSWVVHQWERWRKPIVVSEVGNKNTSWFPDSALELRVRLWVAFLGNTTLIFWNQARQYYQNPTNANIYIGRQELQFVSAFGQFVDTIPPDIIPLDIPTTNPHIRSYWAQNAHETIGYFYQFSQTNSAATTSFDVTIPRAGTLLWYDPASGQTLGISKLSPGNHRIITPPFTEDIAVRITQ